MGVILVVLAVLYLAAGIYQLDAQERALVLRLGKFHSIEEPGLHWNPPLIDKRYTVNVTVEREYRTGGLMLTEDESIVEVPVTVQYNIADIRAFVLNVNIVGINLQEGKPPAAVKDAFDDVVKAKEDQERFKNQAQAYSNEIIPEARGKAQRTIEEANAYRDQVIAKAEGESERFNQLLVEYDKAPAVTRERLYIDAIEAVMGNSSKILIDVEGGNNMMYLPLDKLTEQTSNRSGKGVSDSDVRAISERVLEQVRREQSTRTSRGVR